MRISKKKIRNSNLMISNNERQQSFTVSEIDGSFFLHINHPVWYFAMDSALKVIVCNETRSVLDKK